MLGGLFCILVISIVAVVGINSYNDHKRTVDTLDYVHQTLPKILNDWNYQYLEANASPVLIAMVKNTNLQGYFESSLQEYGAFKNCDNQSEQVPAIIAPSDKDIIADYNVSCLFVKKTATIHLALVKDNGKWSINGINVSPLDTCAKDNSSESNSFTR